MNHHDHLKRFSDAVLMLQQVRGLEDFGVCTLAAMRRLLDSDFYTVNWIGDEKIPAVAATYPDSPPEAELAVFNQFVAQHPLYDQIRRFEPDLLDIGVLSDVATQRAFLQTALYQDFFRHFGARDQIAVTYCSPSGASLGLSFTRSVRGYRAREREVMSLFAPHLKAAFSQVIAQEELRDALTLRSMAVDAGARIIVNAGGMVLYAADSAWVLLRAYFPGSRERALPADITQWLSRTGSKGGTFTSSQADGRLICNCGPAIPWGGNVANKIISNGNGHEMVRLIKLEEEKSSTSVTALQNLGLTPRESEVLHWIAQGKRNEEISIILGISILTVKKHCENMFVKLGVENRSSAVALALHAGRIF